MTYKEVLLKTFSPTLQNWWGKVSFRLKYTAHLPCLYAKPHVLCGLTYIKYSLTTILLCFSYAKRAETTTPITLVTMGVARLRISAFPREKNDCVSSLIPNTRMGIQNATRGLCKIHVSRLCFPHVDFSFSSCGIFVCIGLPLQNLYGATVSPTDDVDALSLHSNRLKFKKVGNKEHKKNLQTYSSVRRRSGEKTL
jgi:hypothetical protein